MKYLYFILISNLLCLLTIDHTFSQSDGSEGQGSDPKGVSSADSFNDLMENRGVRPGKGGRAVCGKFEKYKKCGCQCKELCINRKHPERCPNIKKVKGCFCLQGFYRKDGKCVPEDQCEEQPVTTEMVTTEEPKCPPNEKHMTCGSKCKESQLNYKNEKTCQKKECESGCFCIQGYYRSNGGVCEAPPPEQPQPVPPDAEEAAAAERTGTTPAPVLKCADNEEMNDCGTKCEESCDSLDSPTLCIGFGPVKCEPGCFCKKGHFRDDRSICIPESECKVEEMVTRPPFIVQPECNKPNEEFNECGNRCAESCDTIDSPTLCMGFGPNRCDSGCFCKTGFFKGENNTCIPEAECEVTEDAAEELAKMSTRPPFWETTRGTTTEAGNDEEDAAAADKDKTTELVITTTPAEDVSEEAIDREKGKTTTTEDPDEVGSDDPEERERRAKGGKRRKIKSPKIKSRKIKSRKIKSTPPPEKEADESAPTAPEETDDAAEDKASEKPTESCAPEIPNCADDEEYSDCGNRCMESLDQMHDQSVCDSHWCDVGCFCAAGLHRDRYGRCVAPPPPPPPTKCTTTTTTTQCSVPTPPPCPPREKYSECGNRCMEQIGNALIPGGVNCDNDRCDTGCFCIPTLFRDINGVCVNPPPRCPHNEAHSECGNRCMESFMNKVLKRRDRLCDRFQCDSGCFCHPGLYRDKQGVCVPLPPRCPRNERYVECGNRCLELHRSQDNPLVCGDGTDCEFGCFCRDGYLRRNDGLCVPQCPPHELFSECGNQCMESFDHFYSPLNCDQNQCNVGCFCEPGYHRDHNGVCVIPPPPTTTGCPAPTTTLPPCGPNEERIECGDRCLESYASRGSRDACGTPRDCESGCFCIEGHLRRGDGVCVPQCPPREWFSECGNRCMESFDNFYGELNCDQNRCNVGCFCEPGYHRDFNGICAIPPPPTTTACAAPTTTLPPCGPNEERIECGNRCLESAANIQNPMVCKATEKICQTGCFCVDGYYRDDEGVCAPPPQPKCKPNCPAGELFSDCGNRCMESLHNFLYKRFPCNREQCDSGCFCEPPLHRDRNGRCVRPPPPCPKNEGRSDCGNRCMESLDNMLNMRFICDANRCDSGCFCLPPLFRNGNGLCVEPPPPCPRNERHMDCGNTCRESCENKNSPENCPEICQSGCFCVDGYYRDETGVCVPRELCHLETTTGCPAPTPPPTPPPCPANEARIECGNRCLESLHNKLFNRDVCDASECDSGCFCLPPLYRDRDGQCVPFRYPCPRGEAMSECGNRCMESFENKMHRKVECNPRDCDSGCFCLPPLFRNGKGQCVHYPPPCPHNEAFSRCGNRCMESLANWLSPDVRCYPEECDVGCFCIPGLFRDEFDKCVEKPPPIATTQKPECPLGEEMTECGNRCLESLSTRDKQSVCPPDVCERGCFCANGMFRNRKGKCVEPPTESCPVEEPKCRPEEQWNTCGSRCREMCANHNQSYVCPPNRCDVGCFCDEGLYRDAEGFCVPPHLCQEVTTTPCPLPSVPKCPSGEVYRECASRCAEYCVNANDPSFCPPKVCETGCFCERGLYRNNRGVCVPKVQCNQPSPVPKPQLICRTNEQYSSCGTRCMEYCKGQRPDSERCSGSASCEFGCFCEKGFRRNGADECIPESQCEAPPNRQPKDDDNEDNAPIEPKPTPKEEQQEDSAPVASKVMPTETNEADEEESAALERTRPCGPNEEFKECGHECGKTCVDYKSKAHCVNHECHQGCFCQSGFVRDKTRQCVLPSECVAPPVRQERRRPRYRPKTTTSLETTTTTAIPAPGKCGRNEHYSKCGSTCNQTCHTTHNTLCIEECNVGCFCDEGLHRNLDGVCVPKDQCTCTLLAEECECEDSVNEEYYWCYNECGRTCGDWKQPADDRCDKCSRGCFCKEGLARNENGQCVQPKECHNSLAEPKCKANEVYKECGSDCGRHCREMAHKSEGPSQCFSCSAGCYCDHDFYRSHDGRCVPESQCVAQNYRLERECGLNEEFSFCGNECGTNCTDLRKPDLKCGHACNTGCFCKKRFYRNKRGVCVSKDRCEETDCPAGEQFSNCGNHCRDSCEQTTIKNSKCTDTCEWGCFCRKGLHRNADGVCVAKDECISRPKSFSALQISAICPLNEEYTECGNSCREPCGATAVCTEQCQKGCFCSKGFFRHRSGRCVSKEQCHELDQCIECDLSEYYSNCGSDCGKQCSDLTKSDKSIDCLSKSCRKGCFCKYGFFRNPYGKCVSRNNCTQNV